MWVSYVFLLGGLLVIFGYSYGDESGALLAKSRERRARRQKGEQGHGGSGLAWKEIGLNQ